MQDTKTSSVFRSHIGRVLEMVGQLLKGQCHGCMVHFFNIASKKCPYALWMRI